MGSPTKNTAADQSEFKILCVSEEFHKGIGSANWQPPLHFLTGFLRIDTVQLGKELVGESRSVDRILRGLKLHAEGRQFGDQNS